MSSITSGFVSPAASDVYLDWGRLRRAHSLIQEMEVTQAVQVYEQVTNGNLHRHLVNKMNGNWRQVADMGDISVGEAGAAAWEYYWITHAWSSWLYLYEGFLASMVEQGHEQLMAFTNYAGLMAQSASINNAQTVSVEALKNADNPLTHAFHLLSLGVSYRLRRKEKKALAYLQEAATVFDMQNAPYYALRFQGQFAGGLSYFESYREYAISLYKTLIAQASIFTDRYLANSFNFDLAVCLTESGQKEQARDLLLATVEHLQSGYQKYDYALCLFALGRLEYDTKNYRVAHQYLMQAIEFFSTPLPDGSGEYRSRLMVAACLQLLGAVLTKQGDFVSAYRVTSYAYEHHKLMHHPLERYHTVRRLFKLSLKMLRVDRVLQFAPEYALLKWALRK